jgi:hypothetical protein
MADETNRERDSGTATLDQRLEDYKLNIGTDADLMADQSDKANEDLRFVNVTGGMWEGFLEEEFANRSKMEFDLISNFLYRFIGEWNLNRQGVKFRPDDSKASDDDAQLLGKIYRADFRDGSGKNALDNAVYEVANCGYGAFKLAAIFEDEGDAENDFQRIEWRPINNAFNTVFWDSAATRIDKRDARWVTVLTEFTDDSFDEAFPDKDPTSAYEPDTRKDWNFVTGRSTTVQVATRYEIIRKKTPVFIYNNLVSGDVEVYDKDEHALIKDELKDSEAHKFVRSRRLVKQHVEKSVFSGSDFLEEPKKIAGEWLPIIPMYGYRAFVDGAEWYSGLVRKLKDAARLFNMHMNQIAENSASNGQDVPIFDPRQMPEGIKHLWANKTNLPYLLAKTLNDKDGNPIQTGPIGYLKASQMDANTAASLASVVDFIKETTGGVPQDTMDPNASGKAIRAITKRMNLNTQPIQDNIATAIEWSGRVYQSMASQIYSREQMVRTLGLDGTEGQEQLLKMVMDEKTGRFIEANDLRGKKFRAYADVGPQYETEREETVETLKGMGELLGNSPAGQKYLEPLLAVMMDNMEGVGLEPLKDMNRKQMLLMGLRKPETDEEKQLLAQAQEAQNKPDPQAELIQKLGLQAEADAKKLLSQSRNLDSGSLKNVASAKKTQAETAQIMDELKANRVKSLVEIRKQVFETAQGLPFEGGPQQ